MDGHQHDQRPYWPRLSYGSLDGQPNDRVGRKQQRQLFQHRRQILRAIRPNANTHFYAYSGTDSDGHSYSDGYGQRDTDSYARTHLDADSNCNAYRDGYIYSHTNGYSNSYTYFDSYPDTYSNGDSYAHRNAYSHSYSDSNADGYAYSDTDAGTSRFLFGRGLARR